jgi:hypothetical protein
VLILLGGRLSPEGAHKREIAMIRSLLAAAIGGLVTFGFLMVYEWTKFTTPVAAYFLAGVVSAIGTLL